MLRRILYSSPYKAYLFLHLQQSLDMSMSAILILERNYHSPLLCKDVMAGIQTFCDRTHIWQLS